jgi:hypothetical protein
MVVAHEWPHDHVAEWLARAPTAPMDMTSAPALLRTMMPEFVATLATRSTAAQIFHEGLQLTFDGAGKIAVPTLVGDPSYAAFVKEGDPAPVAQGVVEPLVTMTPFKLAAIIVITAEMLRSSNAEAILLDGMMRSAGMALDKALFDSNPGDASRPAGGSCSVASSSRDISRGSRPSVPVSGCRITN